MIRVPYEAKYKQVTEAAVWNLLNGRKVEDELAGALRANKLGHLVDNPTHRGINQAHFDLLPSHVLRSYRNALSGDQGSKGAFTVPAGALVRSYEIALASGNSFRRAGATVTRMDGGTDATLPFVDDPTTAGTITAENAALPAATDIKFHKYTFHPSLYTSGLFLAPNAWVQDTPDSFDLITAVATSRIARIQNSDWTSKLCVWLGANANSDPTAVTSVTAASPTAISGDDILNCLNTVGESYQDNEADPLTIMCHPNVSRAIEYLKDGNGQYLFPTRRRPFGARIVTNRYLASSITSGAVSLLVGNFSAFNVVDYKDLRMVAMTEARLEYSQTVYMGILKSGFAMCQDDAIPAVVRLVH